MANPEFIFADRCRKDVFEYLIEGLDGVDYEVQVIFKNGEFESVKHPELPASDSRQIWKIKGIIAQMIENAERRLNDETLPILSVNSGDSAPSLQEAEEHKRDKPKKRPCRKLTEEKVIELRRKYRSQKHKNLVLSGDAKRLGVTSWAITQALLGVTWNSVNKIEPPLSRAQLNANLAYPK